MKSVCIHIDETLDDKDIKNLKDKLYIVPHIVNVEINLWTPNDLMVEYEEHYNIPVTILDTLHRQGLHTDVQSC